MNLVPALCWRLRAQEGEKRRRLQEEFFMTSLSYSWTPLSWVALSIVSKTPAGFITYSRDDLAERRGAQRDPLCLRRTKKKKNMHRRKKDGTTRRYRIAEEKRDWKVLRGMDAIFSSLLKAAQGGICFSSGLFSSFEKQRAIKPCSCRMAEEEYRLRN